MAGKGEKGESEGLAQSDKNGFQQDFLFSNADNL